MELKNKVCWVTGASSGIGKELVFQLLKKGSRVIVSSRNEAELTALFEGETNVKVLALDYAQSKTFTAKTEQAIALFGQVDVLFNNGGFSQRATLVETEPEVLRQIMEVNFFGHALLAKAILPHFLEKGNGAFVETSSIAGLFGYHLRTGYSAAKHAVKGFFESVALEYHPKVHVLMAYPGKINTDISLKAVTGNGTHYNQQEGSHEKGYSVKKTVAEILKALEKNKKAVYPGGKEMLTVKLKKFAPGLLFKILLKQPA